MIIAIYIHVEYEDLFVLDLFITSFNRLFQINELNDCLLANSLMHLRVCSFCLDCCEYLKLI